MKASRLPSGRWRAMGYRKEDGKQVRKSFTADTKRQAEQEAMIWSNAKKYSAKAQTSLTEAVETYITAKEKVLSPSTIRAYRMYARSITCDEPVEDLTSEDVQKIINELSMDKSPKTVKNAFSLMYAAAKFVSPGTNWNVTLPKSRARSSTIPTDDMIKEMLSEAGPELKKAIILGALGGLRRGEICGLTYADLVQDHCMVHVHRDLVRDINNHYVSKDRPKNDSSVRYVELSPEIFAMLGSGDPDEQVVKLVPHSVSTGFQRLTDRLGVNVRFHDLRHYSASIMHALGVPDQYIMARHGWKTDSTLKSVYREVLNDKKNVFTDMANDYFTSLVNESERK